MSHASAALAPIQRLRIAWPSRSAARVSVTRTKRAARTVLAAATDGHEVALGLVLTQAENFAKYASVTTAPFGFDVGADEIPVVLGGGVLSDPASILRVHLVEALASALPRAAVIDSRNASPVLGSLLDAMAEGGISITPAVQDAVLGQLPRSACSTPRDCCWLSLSKPGRGGVSTRVASLTLGGPARPLRWSSSRGDEGARRYRDHTELPGRSCA